MAHPSSDDCVIVSGPAPPLLPHQQAQAQARRSTSSTSNQGGGAGGASQRKLSQVIELDKTDDEDDDAVIVEPARAGSSKLGSANGMQNGFIKASSINRTASAPIPSSDDLPDIRRAGSASLGLNGVNGPRSASTSALGRASTSTLTTKDKGKGRAMDVDQEEEEEDPYDAYEARGKKPFKNRKRSSGDSVDDDVGGTGSRGSGSPEGKGKKKAKLDPSKVLKKQNALEAKASKALEMAERKESRDLNLIKRDRTKTVKEVVVHIAGTAFHPEPLPEVDENGKKIKQKVVKPSSWIGITEELRKRLGELDCVVEEAGEKGREDLGVEGALRWTRECDKKWDEGKRKFVALGEGNGITVEEDTRLIFLNALDLSTLISEKKLLSHIQKILNKLPPQINLFLLIFGAGKLYKAMKNAENAEFTAEIREELAEENGAGASKGKKKLVGIGEKQPLKDEIELELQRLQMSTRINIIQVEKQEEAVDWLEQLSMDIAQKPYQRLKQMHILSLGASDEKIVSGKDLEDTFVQMLKCLKGVTEPLAKAVVSHYRTLRELFEAWERCETQKEEKELLVGIKKGNNVNGTMTNRAIGKEMSETIWRTFNSEDSGMFIASN